jgi:hypothetical protein
MKKKFLTLASTPFFQKLELRLASSLSHQRILQDHRHHHHRTTSFNPSFLYYSLAAAAATALALTMNNKKSPECEE